VRCANAIQTRQSAAQYRLCSSLASLMPKHVSGARGLIAPDLQFRQKAHGACRAGGGARPSVSSMEVPKGSVRNASEIPSDGILRKERRTSRPRPPALREGLQVLHFEADVIERPAFGADAGAPPTRKGEVNSRQIGGLEVVPLPRVAPNVRTYQALVSSTFVFVEMDVVEDGRRGEAAGPDQFDQHLVGSAQKRPGPVRDLDSVGRALASTLLNVAHPEATCPTVEPSVPRPARPSPKRR